MAQKFTKTERFDASRKPFRDRKYFLHVKTGDEEKLTKKVKKFGGTIADVLENVYAVITDDCSAKMYVKHQERLSNGHSSSPANNRDSTCTPPLTQRTDSAYGTLSSSSRPPLMRTLSTTFPTTSSGENAAQQAAKKNKFYTKMPSILRQAVELNIKLTMIEDFLHLIDEFETTLMSKKQMNLAPQKIKTEKKLDTLTAPFLKFDDEKRLFCAEYKQFLSWPIIYVRPGGKGTPFEQRSPLDADEARSEPDDRSKCDENETNRVGKGVIKTRTLAKRPTKLQRWRWGDLSGYCDLCKCFAENVDDHVKSDYHRKCATSDENYAEFDAVLNAEPSLNDFVSSLLTQSQLQNEEKPCCSNSISPTLTSVVSMAGKLSASGDIEKQITPERAKTPPIVRSIDDDCCTSPIIRPRRDRTPLAISSTPFRLKRKLIRVIIDDDETQMPFSACSNVKDKQQTCF